MTSRQTSPSASAPLHVIAGAGQIGPMIYQWRTPYILDDSQFRARFGATLTPLARAVEATVAWARAHYGAARAAA